MNKRSLNENSTKSECWAEPQLQQGHQSRKQNKYQANKHTNNRHFNKNTMKQNDEQQINDAYQQQRGMDIMYQKGHYDFNNNELVATVPNLNETYLNDINNVDQSVNEANDDSIAALNPHLSETEANLNSNDNTDENNVDINNNTDECMGGFNGQNNHFMSYNSPISHQQQPSEVNSVYNSNMQMYEYDYQNGMHPHMQQTPQQYYYYSYPEYATNGVAMPNLATAGNSPQMSASANMSSQQQQQQHAYYATYQTIPSYIYDPNLANPFAYSPISQNQQIPQQQSPVQSNNVPTSMLSSPQHQSTVLASYHTPTQPQHQLYLAPSAITPPASVTSNEHLNSNNSSSSIANERSSNCNSPHNLISNQQASPSTPATQAMASPNPYIIYPGATSYLTPQTTYQCQSPMMNQPYMMYHAPPPPPPPPPMPIPMHFSSNSNSPVQVTPSSYNSSINGSTPSSGQNRYNNNQNNKYRSNRYNNNNNSNYSKRNFNQRFNSYAEQTPLCPLNFNFKPEENIYCNSPNSVTQQAPCYGECSTNDEATVDQSTNSPGSNSINANAALYSQSPNAFYEANFANLGFPSCEQLGYDFNSLHAGIESYGDEYVDNYDDCSNIDDDEQLACQVCRGRRMCFCYFLKVRYYKFPSFFDLVDHQYKKWRLTMKQAQKQQQVNS